MNVTEVGAVWRYLRSGDVTALKEHVERGGGFGNKSARILVEALRRPPRKHQNWERDQRIIAAIMFLRLPDSEGNKMTLEKAQSEVAQWFERDPGRIKQIWDDREFR